MARNCRMINFDSDYETVEIVNTRSGKSRQQVVPHVGLVFTHDRGYTRHRAAELMIVVEIGPMTKKGYPKWFHAARVAHVPFPENQRRPYQFGGEPYVIHCLCSENKKCNGVASIFLTRVVYEARNKKNTDVYAGEYEYIRWGSCVSSTPWDDGGD